MNEIERRRTFAIISHPDAGKTTLTEKFLLFGGQIQVAGAVKNNKIRKTATSDWMDIEHCVDQHFTAANNKEAFLQSILAGMDMHMHGPEWQQAVVELVKEGKITEERINKSFTQSNKNG